MCGRYALSATAEQLIEAFQLIRSIDWAPRYNITPTSLVPVIRQTPDGERVADLLKWGLVPYWLKKRPSGGSQTNARVETASSKPSFLGAFKHQRCLVPADGFFEWETANGARTPFFIRYQSGALMALAGLWESWTDPDAKSILRTFCVLTTDPNEALAPIHDRMPLIIQPCDYARWLDPTVHGADLRPLLIPAKARELEVYPVGSGVNKASADGVELLAPVTR